MSHTFDTLQHGLQYLDKHNDDTEQTRDVIRCMKDVVDSLHNYAHSEGSRSKLNFAGGKAVTLLNVCLRHSDDEDRKMWLEVKGNA